MKINLNTILLGALLIVAGYIAFVKGGLGGDKDVETKDAKVSLTDPTSNNLDATRGTTTPANPNFDPNAPSTTIAFTETDFDFGTINDGDQVQHTFEFTNSGDEPLIISNAKGSCGCTVPTWPKEPIAPLLMPIPCRPLPVITFASIRATPPRVADTPSVVLFLMMLCAIRTAVLSAAFTPMFHFMTNPESAPRPFPRQRLLAERKYRLQPAPGKAAGNTRP